MESKYLSHETLSTIVKECFDTINDQINSELHSFDLHGLLFGMYTILRYRLKHSINDDATIGNYCIDKRSNIHQCIFIKIADLVVDSFKGASVQGLTTERSVDTLETELKRHHNQFNPHAIKDAWENQRNYGFAHPINFTSYVRSKTNILVNAMVYTVSEMKNTLPDIHDSFTRDLIVNTCAQVILRRHLHVRRRFQVSDDESV